MGGKMFDTKMLIAGNFVTGTETAERIRDPKTEEVLLDLPEASLQQVNAAVNAAENAFASWSRTTPAERSALLLKLADAIERDGEAFASLEALNCGKPRLRVLNDEIPAIVGCFRFFAGAVRTMHGAVAGEYITGHTSMIRRDPVSPHAKAKRNVGSGEPSRSLSFAPTLPKRRSKVDCLAGEHGSALCGSRIRPADYWLPRIDLTAPDGHRFVIAAVNFGRDNGLPIAIRGGAGASMSPPRAIRRVSCTCWTIGRSQFPSAPATCALTRSATSCSSPESA
jgi:hypothetical protein